MFDRDFNEDNENRKAELVQSMNERIEKDGSVCVTTYAEGNFQKFWFVPALCDSGRLVINGQAIANMTVEVAAAQIARIEKNGGFIANWSK